MTFAAYGDGPIMQFAGSAQNWTGFTKLHFHVKVATEAANYANLSFVQGTVNGGGFLGGGYTNASTFADGKFHEIVVTLTPGTNYNPAAVVAYGVQLSTMSAAPDGGPAVPGPATLELDDIWME
jgi:hypothetical protein